MEPNITSYKPPFWGSMLVFEGGSQMIFQSDSWFLGLFDHRISLVRMERGIFGHVSPPFVDKKDT